jgi:hypothetical protein
MKAVRLCIRNDPRRERLGDCVMSLWNAWSESAGGAAADADGGGDGGQLNAGADASSSGGSGRSDVDASACSCRGTGALDADPAACWVAGNATEPERERIAEAALSLDETASGCASHRSQATAGCAATSVPS